MNQHPIVFFDSFDILIPFSTYFFLNGLFQYTKNGVKINIGPSQSIIGSISIRKYLTFSKINTFNYAIKAPIILPM